MSAVSDFDSELTSCESKHRKVFRCWLYTILILCLAIVMVGGATRMTGSGLSITEWKPIHGIIPPIGEAQWQEEFGKYQQIAQYQHVNQGMELNGFKHIFWWEWSHRLLGRIIGLIAIFPLIFFFIKGWVEKRLMVRFCAVPILIGIQGAIGWWMVSSGVGNSELTSVSQYRLAIHLVTACIIIIFVTDLARGLVSYREKPAQRSIQKFAGWMVFLVLFQIYLGALVAGLHAGLSHNTWPLMDGKFVPDGLLSQEPAWRNIFENTMTVQFIHRMFAYALLIIAIIHAFRVDKLLNNSFHAKRAMILLVLIVLQAIFGIITLLTRVPIEWGLTHQFFALVVLCFAVAHWRATKGAFPIQA